MLFISLLGLGLFLYFINNPHPAVLSNTWWPAFVILIIYIDRILKSCEFWSLTSQLKTLLSVLLVLPLSWIGSVGLVNLHNSQILKDQVTFNDLFISPGVSFTNLKERNLNKLHCLQEKLSGNLSQHYISPDYE